ncbi:type II toxin-antitoxin system HicB family antitoxin [soil metagenome]
MATVVYPAIVERAGDSFSVFFPDLPGLTSAGRTVNEAVVNAEEALSGHLLISAEHGDALNPASDIIDLDCDPDVDEVARVLVRAEAPGKSVRLNITLDEGLVSAIDRVASNRSGFLAEAARELLTHRRKLEMA